jgi:hypothetical protein
VTKRGQAVDELNSSSKGLLPGAQFSFRAENGVRNPRSFRESVFRHNRFATVGHHARFVDLSPSC